MIAVGETNEYAAEVSFTLPLATNPLTGLTGHVWPDFGDGTTDQVKYKIGVSGVWTRAAIVKIREVGYGRFALRLTAVQCAVAATVSLVATVPGTQPCVSTETIGLGGGDINVNGTGFLMLYLAQTADPVYGLPLLGAFASEGGALAGGLPVGLGGGGALARVAWPDAGYVTVQNTLVVEFGNGLYGIPVSLIDSVKRGKAYYYAEATGAQRYESYSTILTGSVAAPIALVATVAAVASPVIASAPAYVAHAEGAIARLAEQYKERLSAA